MKNYYMEAPILKGFNNSERYDFLIKMVSFKKEIWLLHTDDGLFAMLEDANNQSYIPVWPEKDYAATYAVDDWEGYSPERMGLGEFLDWMKELKEDGIMIGAFPYGDSQAMAVDPIEFGKIFASGSDKR
jgi:hypothetical protein